MILYFFFLAVMKAIHAAPNNDTTNIISDESLIFGDVLSSSAYTSGSEADTGIGIVSSSSAICGVI